MSMSKRERLIAVGVGAAVLIFGADRYALTPYMDAVKQTQDDLARLTHQQTEMTDLFAKKRRLQKVWDDLQAGGLGANASAAESQALHAVIDWSAQAGLSITALKPERATTQGQFQVISFRVVATGPMRGVSQLLMAMESATIPVRVTDIQLSPRREGTDDLQAQIGVSTLCLAPDPKDANKPAAPAAPAARVTHQSTDSELASAAAASSVTDTAEGRW